MSNAASVPLTPGTWSITYCGGATRTSNISPGFLGWLYLYGPICGATGYPIYFGTGNSPGEVAGWTMAPGAWGAGFDTAEEAEAASVGLSTTVNVSENTTLWFFYNDDFCEDNEGAITYHVRKVSD